MSGQLRNNADIDELRERFKYDPLTGQISKRKTNKAIGAWTNRSNGYLCVWFKSKRILCHRLAWALHYGHWIMPPAEIDHINRDRADNRIGNLRIVSRQMQSRNIPLRRSNKSGVTGVSYCKQTGMWASTINVCKKQVWLGRHETLFDAVAARRSAENQYGWPA